MNSTTRYKCIHCKTNDISEDSISNWKCENCGNLIVTEIGRKNLVNKLPNELEVGDRIYLDGYADKVRPQTVFALDHINHEEKSCYAHIEGRTREKLIKRHITVDLRW